MTMVHVETPPEGDTNRARVRAVAWLARNGTRVQKRTIAAGKAVGRGAKALGQGAINQVTQPYTITKQILMGMFGIASAVAMLYLAWMVAAAVAVAMGSWALAIFAGLSAWMAMSMLIGGPISAILKSYGNAAQNYHMGGRQPHMWSY